ncbi:chemotaxis protein CheA [Halobacteriales archaeon QS_1_68_17]|nr:MAG: chemotaxis protein CheA [Halobacteriales archaeon QS_1_68_17]
MDDQYLDEFIRESEEAITELNNSLLALESDPDDREAMDAIFRTAHTLKGNFGAMGFDDASDLAHAIEDLLDEMREGSMAVTPEIMDLVFAGVDRIEAIVGEIEDHGESSIDTDEMVAEIRATIDDGSANADATESVETADAGRDAGIEASAFADADLPAEYDALVGAHVELGDSSMPGVDGMLVLEAIREAFDLVATAPDESAIEDGEFEGGFDLLVDAGGPAAVEDRLDETPKIAASTVANLTADLDGGSGSVGGPDSVDEIKSVRVDVDQLDDLHGQVEQLVTSRIKLRRAVAEGDLDGASENLNELDKVTASLQNTVMDMRLIPLRKIVGKFPRLVRDLSREQDKEVDFAIEGEGIELDRTILTEISDPLMHILRNAVDHGIEPPAEREAEGKPREGHIELRATRERDHVIIEVEDDGRGLDVDAIREKAVAQGVRSAEELETMDDAEVYDLIFHPGFTTTEEVTNVSGRGVGMNVVHDTVTQLDGLVSVDSTPGEGTTVSLRLPVTMAIVRVLFVKVGDEQYGVPLKNVDEISRKNGVKTVDGRTVIEHDGDIYPIIDLAEAFDVPDARTNGDGMLVRIRESERKVALACDEVNTQEEVVVKPLEGILSGTKGLSGTAVLGDGNIIHILDVVTL